MERFVEKMGKDRLKYVLEKLPDCTGYHVYELIDSYGAYEAGLLIRKLDRGDLIHAVGRLLEVAIRDSAKLVYCELYEEIRELENKYIEGR